MNNLQSQQKAIINRIYLEIDNIFANSTELDLEKITVANKDKLRKIKHINECISWCVEDEMSSIHSYILAVCYEAGVCVEQNKELAIKYYIEAADKGEIFACFRVANYYYNLKDKDNLHKAMKYWRKIGEMNVAEGWLNYLRCALFVLDEDIDLLECYEIYYKVICLDKCDKDIENELHHRLKMKEDYLKKTNENIFEKSKQYIDFDGCEFRYHPNPLSTLSFIELEKPIKCECCGRYTNIVYNGSFYSRLDILPTICPKCVHDGVATQKFDGCFIAPTHCVNIEDLEKVDEIVYQTPGYNGIQQETWLAHCDDYCAYLGEIYAEDLSDQLKLELISTWPYVNDTSPFVVFSALGYEYEGHLFQCLHCKKHLLLVDRD